MELEVKLIDKTYPVIIEHGLLNKIGSFIDPSKKALIITDDGVPSTYVKTLKKQIKSSETLIIPQGEQSKSLEMYQRVIDHLLHLGFSRKDYIIALGGGVVLDLCGFVASTFKRGLHLINIPTTTLAMVDSSIGGKVAINHYNIKNVIGAFYHPEAVFIDPDTLSTLPKRHYINGTIEALKTGLIGDKELYNIFFENDYKKRYDEIIYRSLLFKAKIVMKDEKEQSIRKILNFGHTFGHAYESYFAMKYYLHGEAVALGILTISQNKSYYDELKKLFKKWHIKTEINVDRDKIINFIKNDKKNDNDIVDLIIVNQIGEAEIVPTPINELYQFLESEKWVQHLVKL